MTVLEVLYFGTRLAINSGSEDKEFIYWTDRKATIYQFQNTYFSTSDMIALEADILLALKHYLQGKGIKATSIMSKAIRAMTLVSENYARMHSTIYYVKIWKPRKLGRQTHQNSHMQGTMQ